MTDPSAGSGAEPEDKPQSGGDSRAGGGLQPRGDSRPEEELHSAGEPEPGVPPAQPPGKSKPSITANRIVLWVLVGGFGLYLIITGIVGMITKAR